MPNRRAAGQKLVNVPMSESFRASLDRSVRRAGYADRSKFIRDAIVEKMQRDGYEVPDLEDVLPPSRLGKGGPKKYPPHRPEVLAMNEGAPPVNSAAKGSLAALAAAGAAKAKTAFPKPKRKPPTDGPSGGKP